MYIKKKLGYFFKFNLFNIRIFYSNYEKKLFICYYIILLIYNNIIIIIV